MALMSWIQNFSWARPYQFITRFIWVIPCVLSSCLISFCLLSYSFRYPPPSMFSSLLFCQACRFLSNIFRNFDITLNLLPHFIEFIASISLNLGFMVLDLSNRLLMSDAVFPRLAFQKNKRRLKISYCWLF